MKNSFHEEIKKCIKFSTLNSEFIKRKRAYTANDVNILNSNSNTNNKGICFPSFLQDKSSLKEEEKDNSIFKLKTKTKNACTANSIFLLAPKASTQVSLNIQFFYSSLFILFSCRKFIDKRKNLIKLCFNDFTYSKASQSISIYHQTNSCFCYYYKAFVFCKIL